MIDDNLEGVDDLCVADGLFPQFGVDEAGDESAQRGEGDKQGGQNQQHDESDTGIGEDIGTGQFGREGLFEGIGVHHHKAVLVVHPLAEVLPFVRKAQPQGCAFLVYRILIRIVH